MAETLPTTPSVFGYQLSSFVSSKGFTVPELSLFTALYVVLFTSFYIFGRQFYPKERTREKAWLLTVISSTGTTIGGLYYVALFFAFGPSVITADDDFSRLVVLFFVVYMALDLVFGYFEYPDQMGFLSGYVHHVSYIALLFFLWHNTLTVAFCLFLPCEIPTAIMCYGQLNKKYRSDWGFGITFFLTRVCYHSCLLQVYYTNNVTGWPLIVLALTLHVYWFYCWIVSQRKKGVIKDLEDRYANQINKLKTQGRVARNFILRRSNNLKRTE